MIIFRYLSREILSTTFAICLVLLLVLISGRFVKYLTTALAGNMDPSVIFAVIGYRIPGFLELTVPLGLFLAILLSFGRLHVDNEMSVLQACGVSEKRLLGYSLAIGAVIALLVAWLSLSISPAGAAKADTILKAQKAMTELDKISAKRFYTLSGEQGVTYAERISEKGELEDVFLSFASGSVETFDNRLVVVVAKRGRQQIAQDGDERFLVLDQGYRFEGIPGSHDYQVTNFQQYGSKLQSRKHIVNDPETDAMTTAELWVSESQDAQAALQWRFSTPLMVMVIVLLAVPLSRTTPRKGRFSRLLPAILIYFIYLLALNAARSDIESGELTAAIGLLPVHGLFVCVSILLIYSSRIKTAAVALIRSPGIGS